MDTCERFLRVALLQLKTTAVPSENLAKIENYIREAKKNGATLIVLPEYFKDTSGIEFAETIPGPTSKMLSKAAVDSSVYLVGGTFIEKDGSKLYNTCTVWNPNGEMIAKFRKMHLFDINIPGGISHQESDKITAGTDLATFCIKDIKIGLGICHDLRFEELAKLYRVQNCKVLIYPSKFSLTTGPIHFELLQRARAADNQVFVIGCSPARSEHGFVAWGYSQVTNPWGKIIAQASNTEEVIYCDLDLKLCDDVRQQMPIFSQRRCDIYNTMLIHK